jgi:hypothetical protein
MHNFLTSSMAFVIAATCWMIDGDRGSNSLMRGYTPKTSSVSISPSGLAVSFTDLTTICRAIYLSIPEPCSSS